MMWFLLAFNKVKPVGPTCIDRWRFAGGTYSVTSVRLFLQRQNKIPLLLGDRRDG
jgi:hypothetical protein